MSTNNHKGRGDGVIDLSKNLQDFAKDPNEYAMSLAVAINWLIDVAIAQHEIDLHPERHQTHKWSVGTFMGSYRLMFDDHRIVAYFEEGVSEVEAERIAAKLNYAEFP